MSNLRQPALPISGYRIDALLGALDRHQINKAHIAALGSIGLDPADIAEIQRVAKERGISVGAAAADMLRCVIGVMTMPPGALV
jgi:hypothetical protein